MPHGNSHTVSVQRLGGSGGGGGSGSGGGGGGGSGGSGGGSGVCDVGWCNF